MKHFSLGLYSFMTLVKGRNEFKKFAKVSVAFVIMASLISSAADQRPNIILILTDDRAMMITGLFRISWLLLWIS